VILGSFPFQTVLNGVDTSVFFREKDHASKENTVLSVTAHFSPERDHHKGGWYLIQLAKRMPEVTFLVAGKADAVEDLPENLQLLGEIRDQKELARLYREAKVSLVTGRRDTFSMPCAESLCCGTPVVGFEAGAPEQISLPVYSAFAPYGDLPKLEALLRHWLERYDLDRRTLAETACRTYSTQTMVRNFMEVYGRSQWN
jgi:glycosyltransferase involved in cell wall biosynthesis